MAHSSTSSQVNTPSNPHTSPMTLASPVAKSSLKIKNASATEHSPKAGTDACCSPKITPPCLPNNPIKKDKQKTKGESDLAKSNKPKDKPKKHQAKGVRKAKSLSDIDTSLVTSAAHRSPNIQTPYWAESPTGTIREKAKGGHDSPMIKETNAQKKGNKKNSDALPKNGNVDDAVTDAICRCRPSSNKGKAKQNLTSTDDSKKQTKKCVVCNVGPLHKRDCQTHFKGERHKQVGGLLGIYGDNVKKGLEAIETSAVSSSAVCKFGDKWYCHVCGSPVIPSHGDTLRKHLGKESHIEKLGSLWTAVVELAESVLGLRVKKLPTKFNDTFI